MQLNESKMLITINYLVICLCSVNSLRNKNGLKLISVETDKSKNSAELLSEENKYLKGDNKRSNENEIILSSCSSESLEINKAIEPPKKSEKEIKLDEKMNENIYKGKMLNSNEETKSLWSENDKISNGKVLIESRSKPLRDNMHRRKPRMKSDGDHSNAEKIPLGKKENNIYPEKILNSHRHTKYDKVQQNVENVFTKKTTMDARRQREQFTKKNNIYPEKIVSSYERKEKEPSNVKSVYLESARPDETQETQSNTKTEEKQEDQQIDMRREKLLNYTKRKQVSDGMQSRKNEDYQTEYVDTTLLPVAFSEKVTELEEIQINIDNRTPENSREEERHQNRHDDNKQSFVPRTSRESPTRELPQLQSEVIRDYVDTSVATRNSTIEGSDHEDQESMAAEENDDEDTNTLVDYPYSVSVQRKGAHYASGALVGERWVLSTAAEFYNVRETIKLFRVRLGSVDCKKGGILTPMKRIVIHPNFIPDRPNFDVSVLRLADAVPLSSVIKPIGLSRVGGKVMSAKFLTTYWPRIVVKETVLPPTAKERVLYNSMRVSTQKLVPQDMCITLMATVNVTLDKSSLCLKPVEIHHSVCMPDVGAPVVAVDGLWGITSGWISPFCPSEPLPTVFTRVSAPGLRTWIDGQMVM